jgi:hypothetical protein
MEFVRTRCGRERPTQSALSPDSFGNFDHWFADVKNAANDDVKEQHKCHCTHDVNNFGCKCGGV